MRDSWQAQARETFRDDLDRQQLALSISVLKMEGAPRDVEPRVDQWLERHAGLVERWCGLLDEVRSGSQGGFPLFAVAIRELVDLAESNGEG